LARSDSGGGRSPGKHETGREEPAERPARRDCWPHASLPFVFSFEGFPLAGYFVAKYRAGSHRATTEGPWKGEEAASRETSGIRATGRIEERGLGAGASLPVVPEREAGGNAYFISCSG
jgi:hypothetical protein